MLVISTIVRKPKKSEMALSNQVQECVKEAGSSLREALAFAARTEHPMVINTLTDILIRLESLESLEEFMDKYGRAKDLQQRG